MTELRQYKLPGIFHEDHTWRELPEEGVSKIVGRTGPSVLVEMDETAFRDLYSDAEFYATNDGGYDNVSVINSARSTVRALERQNPDLCATIKAEWKEKGWL